MTRQVQLATPNWGSGAYGGRVEIQLSRTGVVPHQMKGAIAGRDALVVTDPPRSMLAAARRGVWVERGAGDPYRWLEVEFPRLGEEQDLVHATVRQGEGGDPHPARVVDRQVGLEVRRAVRGRRGHRLAPGPAVVAGRDP